MSGRSKKQGHKLISRRDFLKLGGLAAGGVAAGQLLLPELMAVPNRLLEDLEHGTGQESWINTVCGQCPAGCGLSIRRIDGVPVYVKGNPIFPINEGGVCPMAHTSMEVLFNPDRVTAPLRRAGDKGSDRWTELGWQEAQSGLQARIKQLVERGAGHRIALINGNSSPLVDRLARHFMQVVGSPNYFDDERLWGSTIGVELTQGIALTPAADLGNSRYVVSLGANFLEEGDQPIHYQNLYGQVHTSGREMEFTLVQVDSRLNLTAANADRWIPIRPGTYGALAMGLAYILTAERLYDEDFIFEQTTGFWPYQDAQGREHPGFEAFLRSNYYPERVATITGIPTTTIVKLGEDLATYRPSLVLAGDDARHATNGGFTQWAVHALNALLGNFQRKGGLRFSLNHLEFPFPEPAGTRTASETAPAKVGSGTGPPTLMGESGLHHFAAEVLASEPGLIDTLLIIDSNPVYHSRDRDTLVQALHRIDHVVYMGLFVDETALHADLVLPDHSYLEKSDLSGPAPGLMFAHIGLQTPVVEPLFDTRHCGQVLLDLGKAAAGGANFPWPSYQGLVEERLKYIYDSGQGAVISETADSEWLAFLKERGWRSQQSTTFRAFRKIFAEKGGWWNPLLRLLRPEEMYKTPSGKFEFLSSVLAGKLEAAGQGSGENATEAREALLRANHITARGENLLLPHHEPTHTGGAVEDYPLVLTVSQPLTNRDGRGATQPSLLEVIGMRVSRYWQTYVEINPVTGRRHGLADRKLAWVESPAGRIQAQVRFFEGIHPGVIHIPAGLGHTHYGRFGTGIGSNVADIIENNFDALTGAPALNGTAVKVYAAGAEV